MGTSQLCWEPNCPLKLEKSEILSLIAENGAGKVDGEESGWGWLFLQSQCWRNSAPLDCWDSRQGTGTGNCDIPVLQVDMEYRNKFIFQDMQPQSALHNLGTAFFGSWDVLKESVLRNIPGMEPFGGIPSLEFLTLAFSAWLELWILLSTQLLTATAAKLSSVEL